MGRFQIVVPVVLLALSACGAEFSSSSEPSDSTRISELPQPAEKGDAPFSNPGKGIAVVSGNEAATIDVSLPDSMDSLDPALADEIRKRANSGSEAFIAGAKADREAAEQQGYEFRPHSLDVNWVETGPREGRLAGFLGTYAAYTGGAHPNVGFDVLNWDRKTNSRIVFEDLFDDAAAARLVISEALKSKLVEAKHERLANSGVNENEMIDLWVDPAFDGNPAVFQGFTIARSDEPAKAGGLVYHFAPYEVGAYAEGVYQLGIGYETFQPHLKADYADAFGGQPILP